MNLLLSKKSIFNAKTVRRLGCTASLFLLLFPCSAVFSKPNTKYVYQPIKKLPAQTQLTPEQYLHLLSQSWDSIKTLRTELLQKNPNGMLMTADLYLRRPGEMRLIYKAPSQVQMISTQGKLIHYDGRRNRSQSMNLSRSPVAFLLQGKLHDQVQLVGLIRQNSLITLVMKIKKDPNAGKFGLTFNPNLLKNRTKCPLTGWFMTDPYGKTTTITLSNTTKNVTIAKGTFELQKK